MPQLSILILIFFLKTSRVYIYAYNQNQTGEHYIFSCYRRLMSFKYFHHVVCLNIHVLT